MQEKQSLILIPGLLCSAVLWQPQIAGLADLADIEVTSEHFKHETMLAIATAILATAPPRFALAGLSMGGYIALEILRQAPERIARLALLDTSSRADTPEQSARRRSLMALAEIGKFKGVTPRLLPSLIHPDRLHDQAMVALITGMALEVGRDGFMRQQRAILGRSDSRAELATVRCPALVLCGEQDQLTPPELSREMAGLIPGAELVVLPRCGHLSTLEEPAAVTAAMRRWLLA